MWHGNGLVLWGGKLCLLLRTHNLTFLSPGGTVPWTLFLILAGVLLLSDFKNQILTQPDANCYYLVRAVKRDGSRGVAGSNVKTFLLSYTPLPPPFP